MLLPAASLFLPALHLFLIFPPITFEMKSLCYLWDNPLPENSCYTWDKSLKQGKVSPVLLVFSWGYRMIEKDQLWESSSSPIDKHISSLVPTTGGRSDCLTICQSRTHHFPGKAIPSLDSCAYEKWFRQKSNWPKSVFLCCFQLLVSVLPLETEDSSVFPTCTPLKRAIIHSTSA